MTTPIKLELAKLLKEKGFNEETAEFYTINNEFYPDGTLHVSTENPFSDTIYKTLQDERIDYKWVIAPTIAEVVMWLYEKHRIQLFLDYTYYDGFHYGIKWVKANGDYGQIWRDNNGEMADGFDSWKEAYEAAIEYCLTNLI